MEYQKLGTSDLNVSRIALGCGEICDRNGAPPEPGQLTRAIHRALDLGINFFDTADINDCGHAEEILGQALGSRRNHVFIATKVGIRYLNKKYIIDLSGEHIAHAVDESLRHLKIDCLDLYQIHWPDLNTPLSETFAALNKCLETGKIRHIGLANFDLARLKPSCKFSRIISNQIPLNLFKRDYEIQVIPHCYRENIGLISYLPLAKGLVRRQILGITDDASQPTAHDSDSKDLKLARNLTQLKRLQQFAASRNKSLRQLALAWVLSHQAINTLVCDVPDFLELEAGLNSHFWYFDQEELAQIDLILNEEPA